MFRGFKITLAASLFVIIACGCDNQKPMGLLPYDEDPVYATSFPIPTPTLPTPRPKIEFQGSLTIAAHNMPSSLDVHRELSPSLAALGPGIVYSRLLRLHTGPKVELPNLKVECDLCSSWRLEGATTLEFSLRPDVRWQDILPVNGRPLSGRDVVASLERQRTPGWPNAAILQSISQITYEGETIRFELKAPNADILLALADGHTKILPIELLGASEFPADTAVGTGPWLLADTSTDNSFTFTRNHSYFEEHLPYLSELKVVVLEDDGMRLAAFRLGNLDVLDVPTSNWETVHRLHPQLQYLDYPALNTGVELTIRTTKEPFNDIRLRRALFQALDPWTLNTRIWRDLAVVSSGLPIADPKWLLPETEWRKNLNDVMKAQDLMREAKAMGTPVKVTVADYGEQYVAYGRGIVEQLREVGFSASLGLVLPQEHKTQVLESAQYMVSLAPPLPVNTPNTYMFGVLHSNGQANHTGYGHADLDRLILDQSREWDPKLRGRQILQAQRHIVEQAVRFMPAAHLQIWAWWPRVMDFHPNFANYEYDFWSRVWAQDQ